MAFAGWYSGDELVTRDKTLTFTQNTEGHYTYDPEGQITEVFTGPDGTLVLAGLDLGTYNFKETTAPEGYHVKNDPTITLLYK